MAGDASDEGFGFFNKGGNIAYLLLGSWHTRKISDPKAACPCLFLF